MASNAAHPGGEWPLRRVVSQYLRDARSVAAEKVGHEPGLSETLDAPLPDRVKKLVEPHLFYVVQVANELKTSDAAFEDLLAVGNVGLVEAAHHYDPDRKVKFLTYAAWWIRKRILEFLVEEGQSVRLTRYARERRKDVRAVQRELQQEFGREPTVEEVAERSGLPHNLVRERLGNGPIILPLEPPVEETLGTNSAPLAETLFDPTLISPEDLVLQQFTADVVAEEVQRLPYRERKIIENRFGFGGAQALTFQELGSRLGLSRERARQIEREGLRRLRGRIQRRLNIRITTEERGHPDRASSPTDPR